MRGSLAVFLLFLSSAALGHPDHGALEIHWHLDDVGLAALGIIVAFLLWKALQR